MSIDKIFLREQLNMSSMVLGTFQHKNSSLLEELIRSAVEMGYTAFDTAPSYGNEAQLGQIFQKMLSCGEIDRSDLFVIDKIDGWQMYEGGGEVTRHVEDALRKLQLEYIDLMLIHWPFPEFFHRTWESLARIYATGKVKAIGVCNVRVRHLSGLIDSTGIKPHVVQVERHPLNVMEDLIDYNVVNEIVTQAYSPVCRMHGDLVKSSLLEELAAKYQKSIGQIILRWQVDSGAVPVFMTTKRERLKENLAVFDFRLRREDVFRISAMNKNFKIFLESRGCPGF